jgi:hypothetical protein
MAAETTIVQGKSGIYSEKTIIDSHAYKDRNSRYTVHMATNNHNPPPTKRRNGSSNEGSRNTAGMNQYPMSKQQTHMQNHTKITRE